MTRNRVTRRIAAAALAWAADIRFSVLLDIALPVYVDFPLTILWFLAFMNAFNLIPEFCTSMLISCF